MEFFSLLSLLLPILFIFKFRYFFYNNKQDPSGRPYPTEPRPYPLVGHLLHFLKNRDRFLDWSTEFLAHNPTNTVTYCRPGVGHGIITANPMNVEYMLKTNFQNYPKGEAFNDILEDFLGRGIFNSDGEIWKVQRNTASFEFNTKSFRNFVLSTIHHEMQYRMLPLLQKASKNQNTIDLQELLEHFAFDNVCKVAFNEDPMCLGQEDDPATSSLSPDFARAFDIAASLSAGRFRYAIPFLWKVKKFLNIGSEKQLKEAISTVHNFAMKIIRSRKNEASPPKDDLLSRFIASEDNSDEFLRDIIISFILAGRDTTSSTLAWFFWLLSTKPAIEKKILEEVKSIRSKTQNFSGDLSFDELREMHYLHASISEALRLYPPVAFDTKTSLEEDVMPDGTFVGKGWFVSYNAYSMGRMKGTWGEDCEVFLPERWLENGVFRPESPFRFPAFHGGPRLCLGKEMAYMQMKLIVACTLERFEIEIAEKGLVPEQLLSLTLRIKGGLAVRVRERGVEKMH
ncbi:hypothetical protein AAC387_Pa01g1776 [Persea americana]